MKYIKSAEWAYQMLHSSQNVVFVDCRFQLSEPSKGRQLYQDAHIDGAVYFDLDKDLSAPVTEIGGRHPLPDLNHFIHKVKQAGINNETTVIAYDDQKCAMASRFWWLMKLVGHKEVYIINGGLSAWKENGFPLSSQTTNKDSVQYNAMVQWDLFADQEYVRGKKDSEEVALIDSRSYSRFAGYEEPIDKKAGHIPSAINFEWTNLFKEDGKWKTKEELQKHFSSLSKSQEIIVYCGSGVTAVPNVIGLYEAGFKHVRLYVGSFSDWISNPDNQIATRKGQKS